MGKFGKRLFPSSSIVLRELQRAYSDEWFGHYNFWHSAYLLGGPDGSALGRILTEKASRGLGRAAALTQRLLELGREPVAKMTDLPKHASQKPFRLPADRTDEKAILKAILDAERTSLKTFHRLYQLAHGRDPLTQNLALRLLDEAVKSEEILERMLGESFEDRP